MKKFLLAIVIAAALTSAFPAGAQEKPVDLVVLLDASQSMFPYFSDVVDFVVSRIAREYLRFGDTFHLLTFSDTAQIEIAQPVHTEQDIKSLLGRLYLLYPMGKNTDLVSALTSLYRYVSDLPEANRKLIVMVTDGMHNPSPQSPYVGLNVEEVRSRIDQTAASIRENGWVIRIVRVPFTEEAAGGASAGKAQAGTQPGGAQETLGTSPGAGDYLSDVATGLGASVTDFTPGNKEDAAFRSVEMPKATFPGHLGKIGYDFSFPLNLSNLSSRDLRLELSGVYSDGKNLLRNNVFADIPRGTDRTFPVPLSLPGDMPTGERSLSIELEFADGIRVVPTTGTLAFELVHKPFARLFRTTGRVVLFLALLVVILALILILALYVRGLHRRAEQPIVAAVLDSEAADAAERRKALAAATAEAPSHVTAAEAREFVSDLVPKHVTVEEARSIEVGSAPKHVTEEEAKAFQSELAPKHVTEEEAVHFREGSKTLSAEEAKLFASARSTVTQEEADRYRDTTSRNAADTLAAFAAAASPLRKHVAASGPMPFTPTVKRTASLRVEFRVEDQNPHVGLRNIRTLHSGGKKTIGGKRSDFLVFLVPVPSKVAEVYFDGEDLTIVPLKPEFFPDYAGPIPNCLNRQVKMVSRHGKTLLLSFELYVPPADRLNRFLHCVDAPGFAALGEAAGSLDSGNKRG